MPGYVGSKACSECHADVTTAWQGSHHAAAWTLPTETTVLGDFDDAAFEHNGRTTRFTRRDGAFFVETEGGDGRTVTFKVRGIVGVAPLQQYLVAIDTGRLQALDIAWDVQRGRWYHLYPEQNLRPGDGLHWTGPYKTWNARCAECHATDFHKTYDPVTRQYASTQSEIGVGCEACHGPGEAHLAWAKEDRSYSMQDWKGLGPTGLTIDYGQTHAEKEIQQCAGCHARRGPLGDRSPIPGTDFHDSYRLALLRDGLYHADGTIQDEVYVYGSFLQSKMYAKGVRCTDCHEPHSARLKADGNGVCTQCHSPAGNGRFPSLKRADYDTSGHHFHQPGSEGAHCQSCHMVERVYMRIDDRRDHSFRIPRPDLSEETGSPNACNDCHSDQTAEWAADEIVKQFPTSNRRQHHFSRTFARARRDPAGSVDALLAIAENDGLSGIVRGTALDLSSAVPDPAVATRAVPLIGDSDPLVRAAAIQVQRHAPPDERVRRLLPAIEDPVRSVRIAAARAFLGAPVAGLAPQSAAAVGAAMAEWRASLGAKADYPESHLAIGGAALIVRNLPAAEQAFREAVRLDPQSVDAWTMIIRLAAATGNLDGARAALSDARRANPENPILRSFEEEIR